MADNIKLHIEGHSDREWFLQEQNKALTTERDALAAQNAVLREALERIAHDGEIAYLACPGVPFCRKGEPAEHARDCPVGIAHVALANPSPRAAQLLAVVEAARNLAPWRKTIELKDALARRDGEGE